MAGVYRPRHPERTVLYRVPLHHFDRFPTEYESRFEREYGFSGRSSGRAMLVRKALLSPE
jgi:hypothetical protein